MLHMKSSNPPPHHTSVQKAIMVGDGKAGESELDFLKKENKTPTAKRPTLSAISGW